MSKNMPQPGQRTGAGITISEVAALAPRWMSVQSAANWSGFSDRMIEELARTGQIVSSNVVQEGKSRGRRLILVESLDGFIMAGIARPLAELAMNVKRKGGKP